MVERLSRRDQFAYLRAHSVTVREGRLRVSFVDPDASIGPSGAAVAFAVPRKYGSAVRRNLVRRRLRELVREYSDRGELPKRWFLVSVMSSSSEPDYSDLGRWLAAAFGRIRENSTKASTSRPSGATLRARSDR